MPLAILIKKKPRRPKKPGARWKSTRDVNKVSHIKAICSIKKSPKRKNTHIFSGQSRFLTQFKALPQNGQAKKQRKSEGLRYTWRKSDRFLTITAPKPSRFYSVCNKYLRHRQACCTPYPAESISLKMILTRSWMRFTSAPAVCV